MGIKHRAQGWGPGLALVIALTSLPAVISSLSQSASAVSPASPSPSLLEQGLNAFQGGRFAEALTLWQQTQSNHGRSEAHPAVRLSYMALAHQELGEWDQAQTKIAQALELLEDAPTPTTQAAKAIVLNHQGQLQLAMGHAEAALKTWETAETLYAQLQDPQGQVGSQINQAQALQSLGLFRRAQTLLTQVHQHLESEPDSALKVLSLDNLGTVLQVAGDINQSQQVLEQSLTLAAQLDQPPNTSATQLSLGNTYRTLGQTDAALAAYQQAALHAPHTLAKLEAQVNHIHLLVATEQWSTAQALLSEIQIQQLPASRNAIYARVNLAASAMKLATHTQEDTPQTQPQAIAQLLRSALIQARTLKDSRAESYALGQLGHLYEQTQQWDYAQDLTQEALELAQTANAPDIAYRWHWQLGRIFQQQAQQAPQPAGTAPLWEQQTDRQRVIAAYTDAVQVLQSIRVDLLATNRDVQFSFQESVEPVYRELVSLLIHPNASAAELEQARQVIESLQVAELENFFRSACLDNQTQQVDQIDRQAAVIYPIILSDRLEVILSLPDQPLQHYTTHLSQTEVEQTLTQTRSSLNPRFPNSVRLQLSKQIYDWLIKPREAEIENSGTQTLVFVLDGMFRNIPMSALHDGDRYLIEKYSVALTPGLELLGPVQSLDPDRLTAVVAGLSESRQGFSALPGVESEVAQIAPQTNAQVVLNQNFTSVNLQQRINRRPAPIIHLATHGQFSSLPENTFLLSWDQKINVRDFQSLLRSRDVTSSQPIELLVLSACQTASSDRRAALGLAGLAIRSGARSTLATLWSVKDESTAQLMSEFYTTLTQQPGLQKAAVLRQAQLELLKNSQFQHPYYWAPFVLIGNWL